MDAGVITGTHVHAHHSRSDHHTTAAPTTISTTPTAPTPHVTIHSTSLSSHHSQLTLHPLAPLPPPPKG